MSQGREAKNASMPISVYRCVSSDLLHHHVCVDMTSTDTEMCWLKQVSVSSAFCGHKKACYWAARNNKARVQSENYNTQRRARQFKDL